MSRQSMKRSKTSERARGAWALQDAKARFSELVRKATAEGPQRVSVHGRESVVVIAEEEYRRLSGERSGSLLVELMAASPLGEVEFEHVPIKGPVRDVKL